MSDATHRWADELKDPMEAINVMTLAVTCIARDATIQEAHARMLSMGARHLPVVTDGQLVGILSDRDVLLRAGLTGDDFVYPQMIVGDLMTAALITAEMYTPVSELAQLMIDHKIDAVPIVTQHGELVGLVTSTDLLKVVGTLRCAPGDRCVYPRGEAPIPPG